MSTGGSGQAPGGGAGMVMNFIDLLNSPHASVAQSCARSWIRSFFLH